MQAEGSKSAQNRQTDDDEGSEDEYLDDDVIREGSVKVYLAPIVHEHAKCLQNLGRSKNIPQVFEGTKIHLYYDCMRPVEYERISTLVLV